MTDGFASSEGWLDVYHFDRETSEYTGTTNEWISFATSVPAWSTDVAPGESKQGFTQVFDVDKKTWGYITDHRGETVYSTASGESSEVDYIGDIADGYVTSAPATVYDKWDGEKWVTDTDAQHAGEVASAKALQEKYIAAANAYMSDRQWPGKAAIGRLKGDELTQYGLWLDYLDALYAVDTSATDIEWPSQPA
nr:tail fiber assembly protein [Kosakonia oryziphila]